MGSGAGAAGRGLPPLPSGAPFGDDKGMGVRAVVVTGIFDYNNALLMLCKERRHRHAQH